MLSSISSSSLARLAVLILTLPACVLGIEAYCHLSGRYAATTYYFLKNAAFSDPTNAVFGDSHVMATSRIPEFSFYGWVSEQPKNSTRSRATSTMRPNPGRSSSKPTRNGSADTMRNARNSSRNEI